MASAGIFNAEDICCSSAGSIVSFYSSSETFCWFSHRQGQL